jgi:hypothetical protein
MDKIRNRFGATAVSRCAGTNLKSKKEDRDETDGL